MKGSVPTKLSQIITIPQIEDEGFLRFAETHAHIPFAMKRFYLISNADIESARGYHAHKCNKQMLFCIQGSITVILDDGQTREEVKLDHPTQGLLLDTMIWHEMKDFQKDTILLVLASEPYVEADYIRNYQDFLILSKKTKNLTKRLESWLRDFFKMRFHQHKEIV